MVNKMFSEKAAITKAEKIILKTGGIIDQFDSVLMGALQYQGVSPFYLLGSTI